jgi:RNA polymerase sigma-70 factor (ECF subfamily)
VTAKLTAADVEQAYRKYGHSVLRRARALLGDEADAREALHETFLHLLEQPANFAGRSTLLTWLYSVTNHHCLNRLRNHRTRARILDQNHDRGVSAGASSIESRIQLRQVLGGLDEDLASAAILHYLDRLSQDEIAAVMGCSRRRVGYLLQRLRQTLAHLEGAP